MKTRIMMNKEMDSFRLDVIHKDKQLESFYFQTEKEAKDFQKFTIELEQYKEFI
jgi:hypothetical protein